MLPSAFIQKAQLVRDISRGRKKSPLSFQKPASTSPYFNLSAILQKRPDIKEHLEERSVKVHLFGIVNLNDAGFSDSQIKNIKDKLQNGNIFKQPAYWLILKKYSDELQERGFQCPKLTRAADLQH